MEQGELGLYVHLPLCPSRCPYCDFFSLPFSPARAGKILEGIQAHLEILARRRDRDHGRPLSSVYLGGGTPGMWPARVIAHLLELIRRRLGLAPGAEVTLEANPGALSPAKLRLLRRAGVNRLSLGAQSFQPRLLGALGRRHGPQATRAAVRAARRAGFHNLNLDLIYALPGQDPALARADLEAALELGPEHLSLYELTLNPRTPLGHHLRKGRPPLPSEQAVLEMEDQALELLARAGLERYEVSNFARPGRRCRHNLSTWRGGDYLALGPGAHGHLAGRRWGLARHLKRYLALARSGREPLEFSEELTPAQRALELFMLGLRTTGGVDLAAVARVLGEDPRRRHAVALARLQELGWADLKDHRLIPTPRGLRMADAAAALFVEAG